MTFPHKPTKSSRSQLCSERLQKSQGQELSLLTLRATRSHLSFGLCLWKEPQHIQLQSHPTAVSPPCHTQVPISELERQNYLKCSQKVKNKNAIEILAKEGSALEAFLFSVWAWTCGKNNSHERIHRLSQYRWTTNNAKAKRKIIDKFLLPSEQL